jgi:lipid A 3-O-deacylase
MKFSVLIFLTFCCGYVLAQSAPQQGATEIQVWTSGGHSVAGGRGSTGIWNVGVRYGWILTAPHGPGILKGNFEYSVDAVPVWLIFQPKNTAYGVGLNPLNLKWNFASHPRVLPFAELSGGVLFTNHNVPTRTSAINFTPSAAFGAQFVHEKWAWSLEGRYLHISNAGLERLNPGINSFVVRVGLGKLKAAK